MKFNTPPYQDNIVDKNSKIHYKWSNFLSILTNNLNSNLGDLGYIFPSIDQSTADSISDQYSKSIVYNKDNTRMELNNNGKYEAISTVAINTTEEIQKVAISPENIGRIFVNSDTNELQFSLDGETIRTISST